MAHENNCCLTVCLAGLRVYPYWPHLNKKIQFQNDDNILTVCRVSDATSNLIVTDFDENQYQSMELEEFSAENYLEIDGIKNTAPPIVERKIFVKILNKKTGEASGRLIIALHYTQV